MSAGGALLLHLALHTSRAGSVCLSESEQRHYLLWRPRTCPRAQAPGEGLPLEESYRTDKSQASSFLRALAPAETGHVEVLAAARPGTGSGTGDKEEIWVHFGTRFSLSTTHAVISSVPGLRIQEEKTQSVPFLQDSRPKGRDTGHSSTKSMKIQAARDAQTHLEHGPQSHPGPGLSPFPMMTS